VFLLVGLWSPSFCLWILQIARKSLDPSVTRHRYIDFPLDYPLFLCEKHDALTGNETFQDNLLHALLSLDQQARPAF